MPNQQRVMYAVALCLVIVGAIALVLAYDAMAARRPEAACSWTPGTVAPGETARLDAWNLPDEWTLTWEPYPRGVGDAPPTYSQEWTITEDRTAYFITRGGGKSLIKLGPQLSDYHVVAMCSVEVTE